MLNNKKCTNCSNCMYANRKAMKCYPESPDCALEYDLTPNDFTTNIRCDFYKERE